MANENKLSGNLKQAGIGSVVGACIGFVAIVGAGKLIFATKVEMKDECTAMRREFRSQVEKLRLELREDLKEDHAETMKGLSRIETRIDDLYGGD